MTVLEVSPWFWVVWFSQLKIGIGVVIVRLIVRGSGVFSVGLCGAYCEKSLQMLSVLHEIWLLRYLIRDKNTEIIDAVWKQTWCLRSPLPETPLNRLVYSSFQLLLMDCP